MLDVYMISSLCVLKIHKLIIIVTIRQICQHVRIEYSGYINIIKHAD